MTIRLNDAELATAKYLAHGRHDNNRRANVANLRVGPQSDEETDMNGIGGELAFCKTFNVYPDINIYNRPRQDAMLSTGAGVDIKTTIYEHGNLVVATWKRDEPTQFYALMIGKYPNYRYAGMVSAEQVFRRENLKDLGHGLAYVIDQNELRR